MARRCEHCLFFSADVFAGETESGWGAWYGSCFNNARGFSLRLACEEFEPRPPCGHFSKLPGSACASGACDYELPHWVFDAGRGPSSVGSRVVGLGLEGFRQWAERWESRFAYSFSCAPAPEVWAHGRFWSPGTTFKEAR